MTKENQNNSNYLDQLKGTQPFKTPSNYFSEVSSEIKTSILEDTLPNTTGFVSPVNYFENFKVEFPKSKIIKLIPIFSAAAVLAFGVFLFNTSNTPQKDLNIAALSQDEILNYLSNDLEGLETLEFQDLTDEESLLYSSIDISDIDENDLIY